MSILIYFLLIILSNSEDSDGPTIEEVEDVLPFDNPSSKNVNSEESVGKSNLIFSLKLIGWFLTDFSIDIFDW